jgi:3-hydroxy-9,10-secoandrosta-1,3,5(10)-triene-9,17-dione monooxygenase
MLDTLAAGRPLAQASKAKPSVDELVARAAGLKGVLAERAVATERNGRVSAEVTSLLEQADLMRITKPALFGGLEYGPTALIRVGHELGRGCGSTAWCAMVSNGHNWFASYWPIEAQQDVWSEQPRNLLAGTASPTGRAVATDGGWLITGKWPWASNCDNADWFYVSCMMTDASGQPAGIGWFLTPAADIAIDHDSWNVAGLKGTGSKTLYADTPVFVPTHRVLDYGAMSSGGAPGAALPGAVLANFGFSTFAAACLVGPILGMARGALDWFIDVMVKKVRGGLKTGANAAENPFVQERAGSASAMLDAAMQLILHDVGAAERKVFAGETLTVEERVRVRRAYGYAARQAIDATNMLIEVAGGSASNLDCSIQRHWRDVNSAIRHISLDLSAINMMVGRQMFGMEPQGYY